ncbi:hypothetical protein AJ80_06859 [Polytolypa hystricis UAMH7299]|uniref:SGNH hydrolase-type esterase domain-containing protein n=1 Tax=Polytolypa hystricis (strain UAMH7299) TaxID=1447883 RepID=A0A2B7XSS6_POLH7|nr:hypothetical protein AJ80_06859 [Polytolypa hystricis UAMH7299]
MLLSSYILPAIVWLGAGSINAQALPPAFFLAGDSTTAPDGGWGDAFVASLTNGATGANFGASGRTTSSFRSDGYWDKVLTAVAQSAASSQHRPYVTIQFGHNDQKTEAGLAVFVRNLVTMDSEVRAAGGQTIFLTSLSRRKYSGGRVVDDLENVRDLTIQAAQQSGGAMWADLNVRSRGYLDSIGEENAMTYNLAPDDRTHLNEAGGIVFAGMVGVLLEELVGGLGDYIRIDDGLVRALESGSYYYP